MTVSVVVPLFNKRSHIKRCLDSVLRQTVAPAEVIVVDDGSTDGSRKVVESYADPLIRLVAKENGGVSSARNCGIRAATGEIVAFLDADDEWEPDFIATVRLLARKYPEAGIYSTGYRRIYANAITEISAKGDGREEFLIGNYFALARTCSFVTSSNTAVRKSAFERVGYFDERERYSEDQEMWARLAVEYPIAYSRRVLATYYCVAAEGQGGPTPGRHTLEPPAVVRTLKGILASRSLPPETRRDLVRLVNRKVYERFQGVAVIHPPRESRKFLLENLVPAAGPGHRLLAAAVKVLPGKLFYCFGKLWRSRHLQAVHRWACRKQFAIVYRQPTAG